MGPRSAVSVTSRNGRSRCPVRPSPTWQHRRVSLTITVTTGIDVADTTMQYTGNSPFYKLSAAATQQYVAEEGQICNDMFQAAG
jgi:hypothetical protein